MNAALFAKSLQTPLPAGDCLVFHWLGQHSWLIRTRSAVVGLDLYLTPAPKRLVPPLFAPEQAGWLDMILCSHEHSDHYDRPSLPALFAAAPRAHVVVPEVLLEETRALAGATAPRVHGMRGDDELQVGDIRVRAVPAAHEFLDITPEYGSRYLGFVITLDGFTLYHSGDTCNYEGLLSRLQNRPLDLALLPINGRDAERLRRGCIGNMTYQEAVDLAGLVRPNLVVPAHFGMFSNNSEDPARFVDYLRVKFPEQPWLVPCPGAAYVLEKNGRVAALEP